VRGLLVLNVPGTIEDVSFEQLVGLSEKFLGAEHRTIDGKEMIVIRLGFARREDFDATWSVEIHFDPAVNYMVRKTIYIATAKKGKIWREDEVVQFQESAPGLFFPEKGVGRSGPDGKNWDFNYTTLFSDISLNKPLADSIFRLSFPNGVYLTDSIRGTGYFVRPDGHPSSAEKPLGGLPPPSVGDLDVRGPGMETQEEPRPITRWILPLSFCLAVFGCLILFVRRWRGTVGPT
jgi:hypothetical protein